MHHQHLERREALVSYAGAFVLIVAMVAVAAGLDDREIVLPEIAAMAVALWAYRGQGWMRHPEKIFFWPSITALMGFGINMLALPFIAKLALVLLGMLTFFALFRYSLPPALATGFLPIVTNATEMSFLASIGITTLVLMLGVVLFRMRGEADRDSPLFHRHMLAYLVITLAWMGVAYAAGYAHLAAIPPVTVVVYESLHMQMYSLRMVVKQTAVLTLSATIGVVLFLALDSWELVAVLNVLLMAVLLRAFQMRVPAVYAFPFLAYVFPSEAVPSLPVAAALVSAFSLGLVLAYRHWLVPPQPMSALEMPGLNGSRPATPAGDALVGAG